MFNQKAAAWAYDLVMKMTLEDAEILVPMVMSDLFYQDLHNNKVTVNELVTKIHRDMLDDADKLVAKGMITSEDAAGVIAYGLNSLLVKDEEPFNVSKDYYDNQWGFRDASGKFASNDGLTGLRLNSSGKKAAKKTKSRERFSEYQTDFVGANRGGLDLAAAMERNGPTNFKRRDLGGALDTTAPDFQRRWAGAAQAGSSTAPTYQRIQATGQLVGALGATTNNPHAMLAGALGNFAGQYGPEAEKVVGPSLRRAAYRYRGVERKPDVELETKIQENGRRFVDPTDNTNDSRRRAARVMSVAYLNEHVPQLRLADIQRKSGRVTPSEGVIINPRGEVVAQAFGHADDHYLPFNLKNLGQLNGGEYVRTRTSGGLTSEDVYAGLMSGAKRVTVVSNSGVFSVEFADDLKGVKRYGDKAQSMVSRYKKTLDTIRNGKLERIGVSPEVKAELRDEAEQERPPSLFSSNDIQTLYRDKLEEYKNSSSLTNGEMASITDWAKDNSGSDREYKIKRANAIDEAIDAKEQRIYRLDGDGYSTALEAMKEQYPYFIKNVTFSSRTKQATEGGEKLDTTRAAENETTRLRQESYKEVGGRFSSGEDKGYVKPKHNRPEEVLDGYFDPSINGAGEGMKIPGKDTVSGKTRADRTDYQNWRHNPLNADAPKQEKVSEGEGEAKKAPATAQMRQVAASRFDERNNEQAVSIALEALKNVGSGTIKDSEADFPIISKLPPGAQSRKEFLTQSIKDPKFRSQLADEMNILSNRVDDTGAAQQLELQARALSSTISPDTKFGDSDFSRQIGHTPGATDAEIGMGEAKAKELASTLTKFFGDDDKNAMQFAKDVAEGKEITSSYGINDDKKLDELISLANKSPEAITRSAEGYARLRHLRFIRGGRESSTESSPVASGSAATSSTTTSTSPSSADLGDKTGVKQVASEQPHVIGTSSDKPNFDDALSDLNKMVGQPAIKEEVRTMANYIRFQQQRKEEGLSTDDIGGHMVFLGNPGTGKTSVARIIGKLYAAAGILPSGHVIEVGRSGLVGEYTGQTAPKVAAAVDKAQGGVLFIDEAYTLAQDAYGREAIEELMTQMENKRGKFVVIAAGYDKNMDDFLRSNPGLESRFNSKIKFSDYNPAELKDIFSRMAESQDYKLTDKAAAQMSADLTELHDKRGENFANGRTVRLYWEQAKRAQANRLADEELKANADGNEFKPSADDLKAIEPEDLARIARVEPKKKLTPVG